MPPNMEKQETQKLYSEPGLVKCIDDPYIDERRWILEEILELFRNKMELREEPTNLVLYSGSISEFNSTRGCEHVPVAENGKLYKKIFGHYPGGDYFKVKLDKFGNADKIGRTGFRQMYGDDLSCFPNKFRKGVAAIVDCIVEPVTGSNSISSRQGILDKKFAPTSYFISTQASSTTRMRFLRVLLIVTHIKFKIRYMAIGLNSSSISRILNVMS